MRRLGLLFFSVIWLHAYDYALKPVMVTENIYCFFGKPEMITKENGGNMVNSCYIMTKDGYVVVDSGPTYHYAKQAHSAMKKIADLPVTYAITTHEHDDHWLGNSYLKEQGALLIGPRTYEQNVAGKHAKIDPKQTRMAKTVSADAFDHTMIVELDTILDREPYLLRVGGVDLEIRQLVSKGHTQGDLVVYLPQKKTVFVGDLVFNDRITSLRDGSVIGNLKAIDMIDALDAEYVITGHGMLTSQNATQRQRKYLEKMKAEILHAIDEGIGIEKVTQMVTLDEFAKDGLYEVLHRRNVLDSYVELEMYEEDE